MQFVGMQWKKWISPVFLTQENKGEGTNPVGALYVTSNWKEVSTGSYYHTARKGDNNIAARSTISISRFETTRGM